MPVSPLVAWVITLNGMHPDPSQVHATEFARHNEAAAQALVAGDVADFNACLDACMPNTCVQFNQHTGQCVRRSVQAGCEAAHPVANSLHNPHNPSMYTVRCHADDRNALMGNTGAKPGRMQDYLVCAPRQCLGKLHSYTFDVQAGVRSVDLAGYSPYTPGHTDPAAGHAVLNITASTHFNGTRLAFGDVKAPWAQSQAVANIMAACRLFGTFDNVSYMISERGFGISNYGSLSLPALVSVRYPKAAVLLNTAVALRGSNLCELWPGVGLAAPPAPTTQADKPLASALRGLAQMDDDESS